jgi:hypothetical protein
MIVPVSAKALQIKRFYRNGARVGTVLYDAYAEPWRMMRNPGWQPVPPWWTTGLKVRTYSIRPGATLRD